MVVNVEGIKKLLSQSKNAEIRMGLAHANDMGLDFSDRSIVGLFKEGIAIDVIIKNAKEDDYLPKRLDRYKKWDIFEGFVNVKVLDNSKDSRSLGTLDVIKLLADKIPEKDFKFSYMVDDVDNGFVQIRIISVQKNRFLDLKEIESLLFKYIPIDEYELYLIRSFPTWHHYPVYPMVNRVKKAPDGIPEVGFLLGADVMVKKAVIYHENFANLGRLKEMGIVSVRDFEEKMKKTEYKDFDEMIDDGWRADFYRDYLPKRRALKVEVVDEDGEANFYKFKIIDLIADTVLDKDDVEDLLRESSFAEEDYAFNIKESKLKDFVKIAITDFREFPRGNIMTKEDVEEYLKNTLLSEEFDVINEDGEKINTK